MGFLTRKPTVAEVLPPCTIEIPTTEKETLQVVTYWEVRWNSLHNVLHYGISCGPKEETEVFTDEGQADKLIGALKDARRLLRLEYPLNARKIKRH